MTPANANLNALLGQRRARELLAINAERGARGERRHAPDCIRAREVLVLVMREGFPRGHPQPSWPEIGAALGLTHSTCILAYRRAMRRIQSENEVVKFKRAACPIPPRTRQGES